MGRRRRKKRSGSFRVLFLVALALLVAGFLARRVLVPGLIGYVRDRPPPGAAPLASQDARRAPMAVSRAHRNAPASENSERIGAADRRELDSIIKRKIK